MMKSLWSGVAGMQAHQTAIDVEGSNIANVNTPGFKYSRANFSDLLSQTKKIATAPQGDIGGTNSTQIGLGSTINSTTRIFGQGSSLETDKLTDVAIQGDGFFMLSGDNGSSFRYTRNGDFIFDSQGNLVDQNGNKVQGWVRDLNPNTNEVEVASTKVDSTGPVDNIQVQPGLRIPASPTSTVQLKANLNSGSLVQNKTDIFDTNASDGYTYNRVIASTPVTTNFSAGVSQREVYYTGPLKGQISNHNDGGYKIGTDLGISASPDGKFFNLQTATTSAALPSSSDGVNGQGFVATLYDTSIPANAFHYELRYTDADSTQGHPAVSQIDTASGRIIKNATTNQELDTHQYNLESDPTQDAVDTKVIYFKTDQELRIFMQSLVRDPNQDGATDYQANITTNSDGKLELTNDESPTGHNINIVLEGISDANTTSNILLMQNLAPLEGLIEPEQSRFSNSFHIPSHAASINMYDSLGSRYSLRFDFTKVSQSEWTWRVSVPEPANLTGGVPPDSNIVRGGSIKFTSNGALASYSPPNITFNSNKGSEQNQVVQIDFGQLNGFGGITHLDKVSATAGISQNGFAGGSLTGTRIDESGTIIGSFSNDRAFALAQLSMASFTNNAGLSAAGGNLFAETSNSGEPTIGVARTGGKGSIESSRLEASNVDLTKSLTQLIVIQRGFQANSKTITTSDQMLNTLLQLKQ